MPKQISWSDICHYYAREPLIPQPQRHLLIAGGGAAVVQALGEFGAAPGFQNPHHLASGLVDDGSVAALFGFGVPLLHEFVALRQPALLARQAAALPRQAADFGPGSGARESLLQAAQLVQVAGRRRLGCD